MDVSELPMILFTVLAQMSVGAFLTLGVIQVLASAKFSTKAIDRLADPAILAIGPTLVVGLLVSMLHMHDITHTINVVRHVGSSWLSREIIFGMAFAGAGFVFAVMQWRAWGSPFMRRAMAAVSALLGVGLVWSMANVYASLHTVPAWNSWFTIVQFFTTSVLLGSLAVGTVFVLVTSARRRHGGQAAGGHERGVRVLLGAPSLSLDPVDAKTRAEVTELLSLSIRGIVVAALVAAGVLLISLPIYLVGLTQAGGTALASAEVFSGWVLGLRLALLVTGMGVLALFAYILAGNSQRLTPLTFVMSCVLSLVFIGELLGRSLFYESMMRAGV